jgi:hypothetical protein
MFKKLLNQGQAGDNVGLLLRGLKREDVVRGQLIAKPGSVKTHKVRAHGCRGLAGVGRGRRWGLTLSLSKQGLRLQCVSHPTHCPAALDPHHTPPPSSPRLLPAPEL